MERHYLVYSKDDHKLLFSGNGQKTKNFINKQSDIEKGNIFIFDVTEMGDKQLSVTDFLVEVAKNG